MLIALVCGNMIGSGIYLLPSSLATIGSISLWSWCFTGLGAILLALVFANMSLWVPRAGGPYAYTDAAFGEFVGCQMAFSYWAALWIGNAAIALAMVDYLRVFLPFLDDKMHTAIATISVVWLLAMINIFGVRKAGVLQLAATILKLIPLLLIGLMGWFYFHAGYLTDSFNVTHHSNLSAFSMGAALTLWAFMGLESATVPANDVENPKRNIPLATITGTLIAAVVYITSSVAIMGMIPMSVLQHSTSPFADAAQIILGSWGRDLIAIGAVISCFGALNGWILLQGQIAMAAADQGVFPKIFAKRNRFACPAWGQVITTLLISILVLMTVNDNVIKQFNLIILLATFALLVPYFFTALAELVIIRQIPCIRYKPLHILIATLSTIYAFWAIMGSGQTVIVGGMVLLLLSVVFYTWICLGRR